MLEKIKKVIVASYNANEPRGVFFSLLNNDGKMIVSNGVIKTDKSLETTIDTLYHGMLEKHMNTSATVIADVVTDVKQETDTQALLGLSLKEYGLFISTIDGSKSAVLLPHTAGIVDIKQGLTIVQTKYAMQGNVLIYVFQSERFVIDAG